MADGCHIEFRKMLLYPSILNKDLNQSWYTAQETNDHYGGTYQSHWSSYHKYTRWRRKQPRISNVVLSPGQTRGNNCKMAFSLHVIDSVSNHCNFWFILKFYVLLNTLNNPYHWPRYKKTRPTAAGLLACALNICHAPVHSFRFY